MEHKAFLFDYEAFQKELSPLLYEALVKKNIDQLKSFIEQNQNQLTDPYEGYPLEENWKTMIEFGTPEEYADYALTKYYQVQEDIGLGEDWDELDNYLKQHSNQLAITILGTPFGPKDNYYDPGKMGSYFQSPDEVNRNIKMLQEHVQLNPDSLTYLQPAVDFLEKAAKTGLGLYITF